jgi:hypothetical protein
MSHFLGSSRATYSKQSISGKFNAQATTAAFMRSYKNAASTMVGTSAGGSQQDDEMKSNNHADILEINLGEGDFSPSEVAFTDMDSADTQECNFIDVSNVIPIKQVPKI